MSNAPPAALTSPVIAWRDGAPWSNAFQDIYFSAEDGLSEARHVFIEGIGGPAAWVDRTRFNIAELGFGTGLNFLALLDSWQRTAGADARLHFVSIEGHPLPAADVVRAHARFPELAPLAAELQAVYPPPIAGFHRLRLLDGRVALTLLFGAVEDMLADLDGTFDAWFLDGFAPSKNPGMWTPKVFRCVAELSVPETKLSTFSTAGPVRRGLSDVGFEIAKRPGFGAKRECLTGQFQGAAPGIDLAPFYRRPSTVAPYAHVAVVGAGIAGRAAAKALAVEGFRVSLIDGQQPGTTGFPPCVLIAPRLADPASSYGRFMAQAFQHSEVAWTEGMENHQPSLGALHIPPEDKDLDARLEFVTSLGWGEDKVRRLTSAEASDLAGLPLSRGGIHFPSGRLADTGTCVSLSSLTDIELIRARVRAVSSRDGRWRLETDAGRKTFDAMVLAAGPWSRTLLPAGDLPLYANRGQLNYLPETGISGNLRLPVSFDGHLTPVCDVAGGPKHILGSSYTSWNLDDRGDWQSLRMGSRDAALERLAGLLPDLAAAWQAAPLAGWSGLRASNEDHLPVVGPVADADGYARVYADLHHGRRGPHAPAPYLKNAFVLSGLGSRGYQTAHLAAEVLVAHMTGGPMPVPGGVATALHPGRSLIRKLRRPPT